MAKKVISVFLVAAILISCFAVPALAATSGNISTRTMYVSTKANWLKPGKESITISRTQGSYKNNVKFKGSWDVTVYKYGSGSKKSYSMNSDSVTIKLDRNASYKITVSPKPAYLACVEINGGKRNVKTWSNWYVSKTNKISSIS